MFVNICTQIFRSWEYIAGTVDLNRLLLLLMRLHIDWNQMPAANRQPASIQVVLAAIFKRSNHPVIIKDENSSFLYLSDAACDLLGYRIEELLGRSDHDFLPSAEAEEIRAVDVEILATGIRSSSKRL